MSQKYNNLLSLTNRFCDTRVAYWKLYKGRFIDYKRWAHSMVKSWKIITGLVNRKMKDNFRNDSVLNWAFYDDVVHSTKSNIMHTFWGLWGYWAENNETQKKEIYWFL